jgi:hypothetical protein
MMYGQSRGAQSSGTEPMGSEHMTSKAKGTKATAASAKLANTVAGLDMKRDGNDLVIRLTGLYGTEGVPTATDKDTRKLASSPGMFFWVPDGAGIAHVNGQNRRLGLKVTAILGSPRDAAGTTASKPKSDKPMSSVNLG